MDRNDKTHGSRPAGVAVTIQPPGGKLSTLWTLAWATPSSRAARPGPCPVPPSHPLGAREMSKCCCNRFRTQALGRAREPCKGFWTIRWVTVETARCSLFVSFVLFVVVTAGFRVRVRSARRKRMGRGGTRPYRSVWEPWLSLRHLHFSMRVSCCWTLSTSAVANNQHRRGGTDAEIARRATVARPA